MLDLFMSAEDAKHRVSKHVVITMCNQISGHIKCAVDRRKMSVDINMKNLGVACYGQEDVDLILRTLRKSGYDVETKWVDDMSDQGEHLLISWERA